MTTNPTSDSTGQVLKFIPRKAKPRGVPGPMAAEDFERNQDLKKYERAPGEDPQDDYRHRMKMNGLAVLAVLFLIGAGYWIADTMARMRKDQDCVLSGRRGCTPVNVLLLPK